MRERCKTFHDARLIVIASEGKATEWIYSKALAREYTDSHVHVHILEHSMDEQNNSSPEHVLKQLNDYKSQYELETDDELWLVADKDRRTEAIPSRVTTECSQEAVTYMALSNPCFELQLLLHTEDAASLPPEEQKQWMENRRKSRDAGPYLKVRSRKNMGSYYESSYDALALIAHMEDAIERVRALDEDPNDRWPQTPGTRVYLLAESMINRN